MDAAASDDFFDGLADQTVDVTTTDDEVPGFTVTESGAGTEVDESGTTDTFTVVISGAPETDVVLTVASDDTDESTVSPATLTFTNANWDTPQTVTVTGVDDDLVDGSQTSTVTVSVDDAASNDGFDPLPDQTVTVTTIDDDSAGFTVTESDGTTQVSETGTTDALTVELTAAPLTPVVISAASDDTGEATVAPGLLTFDSSNWDTPQTVTVTGVDDSLVDGSVMSTITLSVVDGSSDSAFDPLADQAVAATTTDDEMAGFTIMESGGGTEVSEDATSDSLTVVLDAEPLSDVVIAVNNADSGEIDASPLALTFTPMNWNVTQTVTVTGVDDVFVDGTQSVDLTFSVDDASSDDLYDPVSDEVVTVDNLDNDSAGFTVTETGGTSVDESGTTDTFTVVLDAGPVADVVISVASGDTGEATSSPTSLTFNSTNWDTPQTVTVTGVDDVLVDGDQSTRLPFSSTPRHSPRSSSRWTVPTPAKPRLVLRR